MSSTAAPSFTSLRTRLATAWHLFLNYAYDYRRFRSASFIEGAHTHENRRAHIHLLAHTLEYGIAGGEIPANMRYGIAPFTRSGKRGIAALAM